MADELTSLAESTAAEFGVPVEIDVTRRRGFDGADTVITVISVVASGIAGGMLAAVGEDFWSRIKKMVGRIREGRRSECRIVVVHRLGDRDVRLLCRVESQDDVDRLMRALGEIDASTIAIDALGSTFELDANGTWRQVG